MDRYNQALEDANALNDVAGLITEFASQDKSQLSDLARHEYEYLLRAKIKAAIRVLLDNMPI